MVDDAALTDTVMAFASRLATLPTKALTQTRGAIDAAIGTDYVTALSFAAQAQRELAAAPDLRGGVAASFAERAAVFSDP